MMEGDGCIKTSPFTGERQSFEHAATVRSEGLGNRSDQCDSQLVGVPVVVSCGAVVEELKDSPSGKNVTGSSEKRKRGRPTKGQMVPKRKPPPPNNKVEEEEDVCFICFDGGSLVLCDRKGCPKAYHPACIKRDEAFFQSTARWNCGWHICSVCQKASHYMCYTCTHSLCKGCTKDGDFLSVRRNMGFCTTCMRTIMLIEDKDQANKELVQVDFDDKSSWEYLFKVYWILLKEKLSLTLDELTKAKNPCKGVIPVSKPQQLPDRQHALDHSNRFLLCDNSKLTKPKGEALSAKELGEEGTAYRANGENGAYLSRGMEWASKVFGGHDNNGDSVLENKNKRRKTHISVEEGAVATRKNVDEYAAIDSHNINLIYLRRDRIENLTADEKFHNMVVGSIVRIRITSCDQNQDLFRLVQVVGTSKVAVPYKIGEKTVDIMLEVLNLHRREGVTIDTISNQEFSEEECRRLRQSIRCGLVKRLTVGEIQKKAMELQALTLNDLEVEILKLNHLRDRASEKGHNKELQECIEKLQLLKKPEERQSGLCEIPEVRADPTMNPDYESEEETGGVNNKGQDLYTGPDHSGFSQCGKNPSTLKRKVKEEGLINQQRRINGEKVVNGLNDPDAVRSVAKIPITATPATGISSSPGDNETDKFWHYRDPTGKIQGPFSMVQLRRWSTTGYFPPDMKIWTTSEDDDLILLTDALNGNFQAAHLLYNFSLQCQQLGAASDDRVYSSDVGQSENLTESCNGNQILEAVQPSEAGVQSNNSNESSRADGLGSISSGSSASVVSKKEIQPGTPLHQELKDNSSSSDHSQVCHPPLKSSVGEGLGSGSEGSSLGQFHDNMISSHEDAAYQIPDGQNEKQSNSEVYLHQSSGRSWKSFPINLNSDSMDTSDGFSPVTKCSSSEQDGEVDLPEFPPPPKDSKLHSEGQATEELPSLSSDVPAQVPHMHNLLSLTHKASNENQGELAENKQPPSSENARQLAENKQPPSSKDAGQDSVRSWSSASSLVVGGAQLAEIADEWGRYSSPPEKPSVDEWSSDIVSVCSLKQPEIVGDHATPTSNIDPLACTSPSHPMTNASGWHLIMERIEFSTLAEESVSDLLAEVDAMEYQSGLASPTSAMRCGGKMMCRNDSFNIDDLNLSPDPGKSDALSSTGDIQLPCQTTVMDEPVDASPPDAFDPLKRSSGHSSASSEAEKRSADIPPNQGGAGSSTHSSHMLSHHITDTTMPQSTGVGAIDSVWGRLPVHMNLNLGAPAHGIQNSCWDTSRGPLWGNLNLNHGAFDGGIGWDDQYKYSHTGSGNWVQGVDTGYARERLFSNTPPPKAQRVCNFFESGNCKKGASCDYLHL